VTTRWALDEAIDPIFLELSKTILWVVIIKTFSYRTPLPHSQLHPIIIKWVILEKNYVPSGLTAGIGYDSESIKQLNNPYENVLTF
jgi:hypothetical protein